jgi:Carboxylesterase family
LLEKSFGKPVATTIAELYPPSNLRRSVADLMGDYLFVAPCRFVARTMQQAKNPVYLYHFAHPTPGPMGKLLGAHHGAEIAFAFDNLQLAPQHSAVDDHIRDALVGYWVQFAATGNPNKSGLPQWPEFDPASDRCIVIKDTIKTANGLRKARLDAIDSVFDAWRNESGPGDHPRAAAVPATPAKSDQRSAQPNGGKTTQVAPKQMGPKTAMRIAATAPAKWTAKVRTLGVDKPLHAAGPMTLLEAGRSNFDTELRHARFLAKAGLAPIAIDPLKQIIVRAPGTAAASEARLLLETIPKAK